MHMIEVSFIAVMFLLVASAFWSLRCLYRAADQRQAVMDQICRLLERRLIGIEDFRLAAHSILNIDVRDHARRLMTFRDPWILYPEILRKLRAWGA